MGILRYGLKRLDLGSLDVGRLPWTDRMFLEFVASEMDKISAPWATCEFDSALMTLWIGASRELNTDVTYRLGAVQDHIVAHCGLFARSLGQFFLSRAKRTPLMGHVI